MKTGKLNLTETDRYWVELKWNKIRTSQMKADESNNEWHAINDAMKVWLRDMNETDPVQIDRIKSKNLALADALAVGKWHAAEAERHIADVTLFLRLKELEML
jgi:hypothetical protein